MADKYQYLFPFEKVPQGSKILIYGAGDVGIEYLQQLMATGYCQCIGFLDQSWDKLAKLIVPIYAPEKVTEFEYEYIVLALKTGMHVKSITEVLNSYGVSSEKIIYQEARSDVVVLSSDVTSEDEIIGYAYENNEVSIAIKMGPGLGDCIVKKKHFQELVNMVPECKVDIYTPNAGVIKYIFGNQPKLNRAIMDSGALYAQHMNKYDLSIQLSFNLEIDNVNLSALSIKSPKFAKAVETMQAKLKEYNLPIFLVPNMNIHFQRMKYLGYNYYNYLNYTGVFNIQDQHVDILLDPNYESSFDGLSLENYITINYGTGCATKNGLDSTAKQWPYNRFCEFVKLFKDKYSNILR